MAATPRDEREVFEMRNCNQTGVAAVLAVLLVVVSAGCAQFGGGLAGSTTPLEGREYEVVAYRVVGKDSMPLIFGLGPGFGIPLSGQCTVEEAVQDALQHHRGADGMINVSVDVYWHSWLLFQIFTTRVEGDVIRFK